MKTINFNKSPRLHAYLNKIGKNEILASWKDEIPMIAVRMDLKGFIFSFGYICGEKGAVNGLIPVISALSCLK